MRTFYRSLTLSSHTTHRYFLNNTNDSSPRPAANRALTVVAQTNITRKPWLTLKQRLQKPLSIACHLHPLRHQRKKKKQTNGNPLFRGDDDSSPTQNTKTHCGKDLLPCATIRSFIQYSSKPTPPFAAPAPTEVIEHIKLGEVENYFTTSVSRREMER